ncbi:MAG: response regulator [Verrucomicrobiota bacterium]
MSTSEELPSMRMLIVDDEDGPRSSLQMIFGDDFEVTTASSGEEAIELSTENPFNLVITDIRMRGLSGIDVLREVKKLDKHTEVIVLTAFETLDTARQAITLGASEYLKKPFDLDHMQNVVDRCLKNYLFATNQEAVIRNDVNAAKTNFLEIVSHELNTPMNGILGFIELLEDTDLDEEQKEFVSTIHDCSLKYFEHVQDIFTYAKLSMSESEVSHGSFNPATMIIKLVEEESGSDHLEVITEIPETLPHFVSGAENEIRIVLRKLLQNAVKFTREGMVKIAVTSTDCAANQIFLSFSIMDTGPGIEPKFIENGRIFDAFSQVDTSARRVHDGLGLGLSLCKSLAERLGATLNVESEVGKGSTFIFKVSVGLENT